MTLFFQPAFFKKQGAPFFKKQGARFLRIVSADWLGDWLRQPLNSGCCNACWDQDVPWCEFRPRSSQSSEYALKFKVFALTFCLLGVGTFSLHKVSWIALDYGNIGCRILKEGIQNQIFFVQKSISSKVFIFCKLT